MAAPYRVVHYLNQFFFGLGGEEKAAIEPTAKAGPVGPGGPLQEAFRGEAEIVKTATCGDNFFAEHTEEASDRLLDLIEESRPHLLLAGPAFDAGRYGLACGHLCRKVGGTLNIPAVTALAPGNSGIEHRKDVYILSTTNNVRGMNPALQDMARLGLKLMREEPLHSAREEGYLPRGFRKNFRVEKRGADRALDMVLAKIRGRAFETELILPKFDGVPPAPPVKDLKSAQIALVTTEGLVPKGNPDRMDSTRADRYAKYRVEDLDALDASAFEFHHGGFSTADVNKDPHRAVPLDVLRTMEREGRIGKLFGDIYSFAGCSTYYETAARMGREIARDLKGRGVNAVLILSS